MGLLPLFSIARGVKNFLWQYLVKYSIRNCFYQTEFLPFLLGRIHYYHLLGLQTVFGKKIAFLVIALLHGMTKTDFSHWLLSIHTINCVVTEEFEKKPNIFQVFNFLSEFNSNCTPNSFRLFWLFQPPVAKKVKLLASSTRKYFINPSIPSSAKEFFPSHFLSSLISSICLSPVCVVSLRISVCIQMLNF